MLDLGSDKQAVAAFLCGGRQAGKTRVADEVYLIVKEGWKKVKLEIRGVDSAMDGSVSNIDIVPGLQTQILKQLKGKDKDGQKEQSEEVESHKDWQKELSDRLQVWGNVFIYIENVPSAQILKKLLPKKICPNIRMRLLLTIRDKDVVTATKGTQFKNRLYIMRALSYSQALSLFGEKLPEEKTHTLVVRNMIKICKGYRSQMIIVREYLVKYYREEEAFKRLSEWIDKMKPSFAQLMDYLTCEELFLHQSHSTKDALLDICSFFNNCEWDQTASIVDIDVLETLEELGLVERESNKVVVRDKVMQYCLSLSKGVRITSASDLHTVLAEQKDLHSIQGIWLLQNKFPFPISSQKLDEMPNLRVLALGDWTIVKGKCKNNFSYLRYLQAGRTGQLPFTVSQLDNLRFLDYNSHHHIEMSKDSVPQTLRMVTFKALQKFENYHELNYLPKECKLRELDMEVNEVEELPERFCELHGLEKLILRKNTKMKILPKSFGKLQYLKILDLSHCQALIELPPNFGWLSNLENVNFSYCRKLKSLPESVSLLSSVKEINLSYCKSIEQLPESFFKLYTLHVLNLRECTHLSKLPPGFEGLSLKEVSFEACKRLKALPINVGQTTLMQKTVSLSWCFSLPGISKGFINIIKARVEELILVNCISLYLLPEDFPAELCALKSLNLSGCRSLVRLPKRLSKLQCLEKLNLSSCDKLDESSIRLSRLPALKELNVSNCKELKGHFWLSSLTMKNSMTFMDIHHSPNLVHRWNQMQTDNTICHFTVSTGRPAISLRSPPQITEESRIEKVLKLGAFNFFNGKWFLVDVSGRPFYPYNLENGTTLAVIFDHSYQKEELQALGKILDDLLATSKNMQVVYIGNFLSALARELIGRHRVCSCDDYEARLFFEKVLSSVESFDTSVGCAMMTSEVLDDEKHKFFSTWTCITNDSLRTMAADVPTTKFLRLMELTQTAQNSNAELLQALLLTKEINFLITSKKQVEIKELQGKFVFLLLSWLHNIGEECSVFSSVYERLKNMLQEKSIKNNPDFEVVWIPIVTHGRDTRALHADWIEETIWPSIADPWSIDPTAMHFFRRHPSFNKLPLLMAVSPTGKLYSKNLIPNIEEKEAEVKDQVSQAEMTYNKRQTEIEIETTEALYEFIEENKE